MKVNRVPRAAHGFYNLVTVDTLFKLPKINSFITKARSIIKMLAFKTQDIEKAEHTKICQF